MTKTTFNSRAKVLVALGVTSLALAAAGPAAAADDKPPVDANGKKSCEYAKWGGGTGYYPHGTTITVTLPEGGSKTVKCSDGDWVAARTATTQPPSGYMTGNEAPTLYMTGSKPPSGYMTSTSP